VLAVTGIGSNAFATIQMLFKALVFLAVAVPSFAVISDPTRGLQSASHPADERLVKAFKFDQQFIACNAYPSHSPMTLTRNGNEPLASGKNALRFRECREFNSRLQAHDKLDLTLSGIEIHGSFEVGALPASDAVLLLVLQKRDHSKLLSFQSFAFATGAEKKEAQLAVIDAYKANHSSFANLIVEDHITKKENHAVSKRMEELNFNRVYTVEEGSYDAHVSNQQAKKLLNLVKSRNFCCSANG